MRHATVPIILLLLGCDTTANQGSGGVDPDDPRVANAPVLDEAHLGWKAQNCENCHELPVVNHVETESSSCASCHGGNGACLASADSVARVHDPSEDCVICHEEKHGFQAKDDCTNCHYADKGGVDCGGGPINPGNGLSNNLVVDCYDLNNAANIQPVPTRTALQVGESAVEFTLKDRAGTDHTLSTLLETKPVALVFGAYT